MDLHLADDIVTLVLLGLIALLVGLPGILVALWKVSRPPLGAKSFRWLYLAWACTLAATLVWSLSRDALLSAEEAGANNFIRLGFLALGALVIAFVGMKYKFAFLRELSSGVLGLFALFALWGLASTLWSVSPVGTLYKAVEYGVVLSLFAVAASSIRLMFRDPDSRLFALKRLFDWHWFLLFLLTASVYVGVLVFPEYAILRNYRDQVGALGFSLQGALPGLSENAVGTLGAILAVVAFVRMLLRPKVRMFWAPIFVLSLVTMVLTQSRSPILAFVVAGAAVLLASRRLGVLLVAGTLAIAVVLTQYGQLLYDFMVRGQSEENLTQLTGRVSFWQESFEAIQERPLSGYGANVGGRYVLESAFGETISTVHSSYVEVLIDTGAVGLVLLLAGLFATWAWMFKLRSHMMLSPIGSLLWVESLGVLTVLSVRSLFAVTLVWAWYVLSLGIVLVFVSVARREVGKARPAGAAPAQPLPAARRRRSGVRG